MIEPSLALQTAINTRLISTPAVTALVAADQIRTGSMRREQLPSVIMAGAQIEYLGYGAGNQYSARVWLDLHIWALDGAGGDLAKAIGFAMHEALRAPLIMTDCSLDLFEAKTIRWLRDPDPEFAHGVLNVEAVVRWKL
ncbi:DUF3168 domain-containing protein [Mesorhizobium sp.]|uniref:DUF3168 domain-containing protein n=1 Tax=Mesorhizobium sp. TaxID=1871066 RepID=UPI000FE6ADC2|nr:DUF3168 domain-containing protein [Mesorhizobium sp.]RWO61121.1 MAG: DUF3168 domain-containing protein [Mesorhizobium sp.]